MAKGQASGERGQVMECCGTDGGAVAGHTMSQSRVSVREGTARSRLGPLVSRVGGFWVVRIWGAERARHRSLRIYPWITGITWFLGCNVLAQWRYHP